METTRATPPERPAQPTAAGTGRPGAADDQATPRAPRGFALLLATLGDDGALPVPGPAQEALVPQPAVLDAVDGVAPGEGEICDASRPPDNDEHDVTGLAAHLGLLLNQVLPALDGQGIQANSMVAETARIDGTAPPQAGRVGARAAGAAAARLHAGAGRAAPAAMAAAGTGDAPGAGTSVRQGANAATGGAAVPFAPVAQTADVAGEGGRAAVRGELSSGPAPAVAAAPLSLVQALADAASVRSRAAPAAQTAGEVAAGDAGVHQPRAPWAANGTDAAAALAQDAPAGESFMEQLSEQVAFWVHQKTQRAELTLDRDGEVVRVHLTLTGDAAKITFLSDHAEARRAFDAGIDDLRAMLSEQGLELAGVNVGIAAQHQASPGANTGDGGKASSEGEGARQGVARVEVPTTPASAAGRSGRARALDVFV